MERVEYPQQLARRRYSSIDVCTDLKSLTLFMLTLFYDKPFRVSIKHCLSSVMLELVSDLGLHCSATHTQYSVFNEIKIRAIWMS